MAGVSSSPARRRTLLAGALALVVIAVLAVVSLAGGGTARDPGSAARVDDPGVQARLAVPRRDPADPLALGRPDAPVVMAVWSDFQCPFCRLWAERIAPPLIAEYVDRGLVRLEWHDFAYLGPESVLAARGARAAARQDAFWAFHDELFRGQQPKGSGAVTEQALAATAARLGLDVGRFDADLADPAIARTVADDERLGARLGVGGVPSFVVDDRLVFGAQPVETFRRLLDAALAARTGR